jgi:competence protein ComGD
MIHNHKLKHNSGFTFIEVLLVISMVMMLTIFSVFNVRANYEKQIVNYFIKQFQEDIWLAQEYAISHSHAVDFTFYSNQAIYDLREKGFRRLIVKREYHPQLIIEPLTITNPIVFHSNGNINRSGSMYVKFKSQTYKVVFQLGKGRFYIVQL